MLVLCWGRGSVSGWFHLSVLVLWGHVDVLGAGLLGGDAPSVDVVVALLLLLALWSFLLQLLPLVLGPSVLEPDLHLQHSSTGSHGDSGGLIMADRVCQIAQLAKCNKTFRSFRKLYAFLVLQVKGWVLVVTAKCFRSGSVLFLYRSNDYFPQLIDQSLKISWQYLKYTFGRM